MSVRKDSGLGPDSVPSQAQRASVRNAVEAAQRYLLSIQAEDGHWCGELEGDTILESEYVLTMHFLGRIQEDRCRKAAEYLRRKQLPGGGWAIYEGGPAEVSSSVKAYFVLKLMGDDPDAPHMVRGARDVILSLGGIEACNSFTRIYLAIFGQCSWDDCPAVPPEIVLLPDSFVFNIYKMSSWSRGIVVPLSVIWASKPSCPVPDFAAIPELHIQHPKVPHVPRSAKERYWRALLHQDRPRPSSGLESAGLTPLRKKALAACEQWIHERLVQSDGLGAIFPPIINTIIAFRCLGYAMDDPRLVAQVKELERLELEDDETLHLQPCFSPVWDTAIVMEALSDGGTPADDPALLKAARWLLDREVKHDRRLEEGLSRGRARRLVLRVRQRVVPRHRRHGRGPDRPLARPKFPGEADDLARQGAIARGQAWLLAMQNRDGGWGAFDKDCDNEVLTYIPFADHNAMIDPSCEDITGRVLEAFHAIGVPADHPAVRRAAAFVESKQYPDGTWYGRWGCNYIYGSFLALRGLAARRAPTCASRATRRRPTGSAPARTPTAAGASCRTPTTTRRPRARARRRPRRRRGR